MEQTVERNTPYDFGTPNEEGYVPILLHTLRIDSTPHFNLYNRVGNNYILYRAGHHPFTEKQRNSLLDNDVTTLYLPFSALNTYWNYIEDNITDLLQDPFLPAAKKAQVFHSTSLGLCKKIITTSPTPEKLSKASEVVISSKTLLERGQAEFHAFVEQVSRNTTIATHSLNVCTYGIALAQAIGAAPEEIKKLGVGLLLHDLGMLDIPEHIINKTGPLSSSEWKQIKAHPGKGLAHYRQCGGTDETVELVIYCHHEHLNGNGYPRGLSGRQLPLFARIASIANIFDALTTKRTYRPALSTYNALRTMKLELDQVVDQQLLTVLIRLLGAG